MFDCKCDKTIEINNLKPTKNGQSTVYTNTVQVETINHTIKIDNKQFVVVVIIPISFNNMNQVPSIVNRIKEQSSKSNIAIIFGVNKKLTLDHDVKQDWYSKVFLEMKDQLKNYDVPIQFQFYHWGAARGNEESKRCQLCIRSAIIAKIDSQRTTRSKASLRGQFIEEENKCSYPYGASRNFIHKADTSIQFINGFKTDDNVIYIHSQDSDNTSLSLNTSDPYYSKLKKNIDELFYDELFKRLLNHYETYKKWCLVYGGAYTHFACEKEQGWEEYSNIKKRNCSYTTNLGVYLSNLAKYYISLVNPLSVYYSEANTIYLSSVCMDPTFKKRFLRSSFGEELETKEFLDSFFKDIPVQDLKSLIVYDPELTVSTSIFRPGRERDYIVTNAGDYSQDTGKLYNVSTPSIRGIPQTINGTLHMGRLLNSAFKHLITGNDKNEMKYYEVTSMMCDLIKIYDRTNSNRPNRELNEIKSSLITLYGDHKKVIKIIRTICESRQAILSQCVG